MKESRVCGRWCGFDWDTTPTSWYHFDEAIELHAYFPYQILWSIFPLCQQSHIVGCLTNYFHFLLQIRQQLLGCGWSHSMSSLFNSKHPHPRDWLWKETWETVIQLTTIIKVCSGDVIVCKVMSYKFMFKPTPIFLQKYM